MPSGALPRCGGGGGGGSGSCGSGNCGACGAPLVPVPIICAPEFGPDPLAPDCVCGVACG